MRSFWCDCPGTAVVPDFAGVSLIPAHLQDAPLTSYPCPLTYTAGAINYFVCRERSGTGKPAAVAEAVSTTKLKAQEGDPHGERAKKSSDPH